MSNETRNLMLVALAILVAWFLLARVSNPRQPRPVRVELDTTAIEQAIEDAKEQADERAAQLEEQVRQRLDDADSDRQMDQMLQESRERSRCLKNSRTAYEADRCY